MGRKLTRETRQGITRMLLGYTGCFHLGLLLASTGGRLHFRFAHCRVQIFTKSAYVAQAQKLSEGLNTILGGILGAPSSDYFPTHYSAVLNLCWSLNGIFQIPVSRNVFGKLWLRLCAQLRSTLKK
ncbi:hypothetical protein METBIDRAFT_145584 [Metschnikowia bicuspidata var. bicuspidata NRRL YB-4993]|uniref:Uncharacterized protein n=1 Tax=Metschnikowia bicuspidata var. bicuspidata NRRL YB-4993 TaxID=869754 RepID=A0A1A0HDK8_9ASCO|nr:hypothetical protein METBIDRAFT_145584 [Metschnikowia bicuspidata var. bicuspidata NRRL YB-4993]OBA22060.1 hypothetical protein METBIDRAFT_145584 [Metschnikowia bicuspidata var. bicuspidata NRRL YB-4993]